MVNEKFFGDYEESDAIENHISGEDIEKLVLLEKEFFKINAIENDVERKLAVKAYIQKLSEDEDD